MPAKANKPDINELLAQKIAALTKVNPNSAENMTTNQLLELTYEQVYLLIRTGEWAIEDFTLWGVAVEGFIYGEGVDNGRRYEL
jgi:undecaprenyl pyrophosphate synthase